MKFIHGLIAGIAVVVASMILTPIVSPDSLVWYLAAVAGITGGLAQAISKRWRGK